MKPSFARRKSGFTLIEVLLVLVILVVLASLAVVAYLPAQEKAARNAAKTQVDLFATAIDAYQLDIGAYPSTGSSLQALRYAPPDIADPTKWNGPYLSKEIPPDPWGQPYQYQCPGNHNVTTYDVWTVSPKTGEQLGNWTQDVH